MGKAYHEHNKIFRPAGSIESTCHGLWVWQSQLNVGIYCGFVDLLYNLITKRLH